MSECAAIVLAAGGSKRLGEPKQLVTIAGERLLNRAVRVALEAGCAPVIVVLGSSAEEIRQRCWPEGIMPNGVAVQMNHRHAEGMASSIHAGISALASYGVAGTVLMTCDMPAVDEQNLRLLRVPGDEVRASFYAGRKGVPAYVPAAAWPELMKLRGDEGARSLLKDAACVQLPGGELDVDTPEDLARVREVFGSQSAV